MNEVKKRSIGDNIRELRELHGLTLWKLAQRAGVGYHTLKQWEQNRRSPQALLLRPVARALMVSVDRLLDGVEEDGAPTVQAG
jgi:transcriptional regulator with XRE-family HTH domain